MVLSHDVHEWRHGARQKLDNVRKPMAYFKENMMSAACIEQRKTPIMLVYTWHKCKKSLKKMLELYFSIVPHEY